MREFLEKVLAGEDLTRQEANRVSHLLIEDVVTPSQVGALLAALRMKGETPTEILGFVEAMRERAVNIECPIRPVIDTCGTGGDGSGSFNISTLAALVVAACGQPVAK
ncbi:MAG: anthranilate phosphoribosyltransferase, partial [Acidobacteria bacterium]